MRVNWYVLIILLLALCLQSVATQTVNPARSKPQVIAEAFYSGSGMAKVVGKYLFARVYSDGVIEFDDYAEKTGFFRRQSKMTDAQMSELNRLLSDDGTTKLLRNYEALYPT